MGGWTPFGTRCFKFFDSHLTWTEAEKSCQSLGANLASIHSAEEHTFISGLIKEANGENWQTWIGGQDAVQENLWLWSDGSVWDYSNWGEEEPNNAGGNEHFAVIYWEVTVHKKSVQNKNRTKSYTHHNVFAQEQIICKVIHKIQTFIISFLSFCLHPIQKRFGLTSRRTSFETTSVPKTHVTHL
uniref:C-type lectin domain-containing protein n=1 Tax=Neogobius melanostomus TaxID=47308 RepID=A0A8C6TAT9_9GOBI